MNFERAVTRPRTRPFREEMALDELLFVDGRQVRLISFRHLVRASASARRTIAHRMLAEALGGSATRGEA